MDVRACKSCGKLFNYLSGPPICMACKDELEKKFQLVKEYIRDNKGASMQQIADDNEVPIKQLQQWVREERLEFTEESPIQIECESCGTLIRTGRFCEKCKDNMASGLTNAFKKEAPPPAPKKKPGGDGNHMRFLK
ncbi:MAG: flagellar protein [Lachnospiraceae bacterium]|nr:flagellar protein [Lachnospiraceae bacterium]